MKKEIEYEIIKDFIGWAVSIRDNTKNIEKIKLGFINKEDAEQYIEEVKKELTN